MKTVICQNCGKEFLAKRSDAKTCGPTCRTQLKRSLEQQAYERGEAFALVRKLIVRAEGPFSPDDVEAVRKLRDMLNSALV